MRYDKSEIEGHYYCTYEPAERDMRQQAEQLAKYRNETSMLHFHQQGEPCIEPTSEGGSACQLITPT